MTMLVDDDTEWTWLRRYPFEEVAAAFTLSVGEILRYAREAHGYSRVALVQQLARILGDRSLITYENGRRHLSLERTLDLCIALRISMPGLIREALLRTRHILEAGTTPAAPETDRADDDTPVDPDQAIAAHEAAQAAALARRWSSIAKSTGTNHELARLRAECGKQRERADTNGKAAEEAEARVRSLSEQLDVVTTAHATEVKQLKKEYRLTLRQVRKAARQELATVRDKHTEQIQRLEREHAYRMEQLVSKPPLETDTDTGHASATNQAGFAVYQPDILI